MTPPPTSGDAVCVTLHPGEDVLLRPGARLTDVRAPLAALTRRPELRYATFTVDDVPLTDDQVVGERPLLPGAVLGVRLPGRNGVERTPAPGAGPGPGPALGPALGSADGRPWLVARVTGPDAGTVVGVAGPLAALRTWVRLRPGGRLAVRRTRGPAAWLTPRPAPPHSGMPWALTLLPAAASLSLALALRQPLLAVFALVGVAVALPQLRAARQRATAHGGPQDRAQELPGPARLLAFAHAAHHVSPGAWAAALDARAAAPATRPSSAPGTPPGTALGLLPARPDDPWEPLLHDGAVAVLGPADLAGSVARALVAGRAARGATVRLGADTPGWSWVRWLPRGGPLVLVLDGAGPVPGPASAVGAAVTRARAAGGLVVSVGAVPPGCRAVAHVLDARRVRISGPDGTARVVPLVGVTTEWAEHLARLLAGAARLGRTAAGHPEDAPLPSAVSLTRAHGLAELPGPEALAQRWSRADGWAVPLGIGTDGAPVCLDLVRDGPHLLVAGTTGSGKSELLQALVLGLALTRSPADLALVLVDFKGGASLGACPGLPHVVGQVTDLEPGLAARALAGLRAELRRRERVLAVRGLPDVAALPPGVLPRLVVVIDEFRALADDLPAFLPALLRVAAQGRSLGVHLVLATQRPGGAVGPDLRANVSARVALRVTDPLESRDVLDDPVAASIPVAAPGRAVLRLGPAPPVPLQCAHVTAAPETEMPLVRRAPAWPTGRCVPGPAGGPGTVTARADANLRVRPQSGPGPARPDTAVLVVDTARRAASALGHTPGAPPWLPQLPQRAGVADLPPATRRDRSGLVLALGDDPDRQRRTAVTWDPDEGHLAIVGRGRSGRTTALVTLALAALQRGWTVHGIARDPRPFAHLRQHPGYGGTVRPDDAGAVARLLADADARPDTGADAGTSTDTDTRRQARALVLVDGVEDARATLSPAALRSEVAFAVTAEGPSVGGLTSRTGPRLVLLGTDRAADVALGAPVALAGSGGPPGRAAWCGRSEPVLCQVLEPAIGPEPPISPRSRSPTWPPRRTES
ncbi:FtsK/SpoIIIE domain-containing protein [Promicromonospora iranensis]|uniref:S-DNA-T family DNA segregation ATPase FtsK/SpoIIIE n=1 Tax=Promicromonospora iranensis TaxID=1105144 RepID=A0ABU2CRU2_9MICO|nr:FtsK/SpoIIIE domain-containing protein [Promicromonospora iranensis]MDR7384050.1 S-DNA-T family DNA segregation ATPase FtsK/SpoIIIE [Promicromonospora iranensis]